MNNKLSLICFGLSYLPRQTEGEHAQAFYRMPRISLARTCQQFLPDYNHLLLVDELVMDEETCDGLIRGLIQAGPATGLMTKVLRDEGFLRVENFDLVLREQQAALEASLRKQLQHLEAWRPVVQETVAVWRSFYEGLQLTLRPRIKQLRADLAASQPVELDYARQGSAFIHEVGGRFQMMNYYSEEALSTDEHSAEAENQQMLREFITEQLAYVQANLCLAKHFSAALHDWCDFQAFYREAQLRSTAKAVNKKAPAANVPLGKLKLPELTFWHPDNVVRALKSKRAAQLRQLLSSSVAQETPLDVETASRLLDEVSSLDKSVPWAREVAFSLAADAAFPRLQLITHSHEATPLPEAP